MTPPDAATPTLDAPKAPAGPMTHEPVRAPVDRAANPLSSGDPTPEDPEVAAPAEVEPEAVDGESASEGEASAIELTLPEDTLLTEEDAAALASLAGELGLTQEQAERLLQRDHETLAARATAQQQALSEARAQWAKDMKADEKFGGENLEATDLAAATALHTLAPKFYSELKESGWIDYPPLKKFAATVAGLLREQGSAPTPHNAPEPKDPAKMTPRELWKHHYGDAPFPGRD